jgi:histidinol dehydrogenase
MLEIMTWAALDAAGQKAALARAPGGSGDVEPVVREIVARVKAEGDTALADYAKRFDRYEGSLDFVPAKDIKAAVDALNPALRRALEEAIENVTAFHAAEKPAPVAVETKPGVRCRLVWRPIERVGLYIPAGTAPLFSSLIMNAIPAKIAGCRTRILCSPPRGGAIDPVILATAALCGMERILPIGGAQAIAAMAFGTATVPKVDKIAGPGNAYVTFAKQLVAEDPDGAAIDMPAGPSEVMVVAEGAARPAWIAADLLAQAEHGTDSQALFVTSDAALAEAVRAETLRQVERLPRRAIAEKALASSRILIAASREEAFAIANRYAPEHLILMDGEADSVPESWVEAIFNAGSVFAGAMTPETAGDYASGTNHVLPTYGYARAYAGLSVYSFMRSMTVQSLTQAGLEHLAPSLITLAEAEGLQGHAEAARLRQLEKKE